MSDESKPKRKTKATRKVTENEDTEKALERQKNGLNEEKKTTLKVRENEETEEALENGENDEVKVSEKAVEKDENDDINLTQSQIMNCDMEDPVNVYWKKMKIDCAVLVSWQIMIYIVIFAKKLLLYM